MTRSETTKRTGSVRPGGPVEPTDASQDGARANLLAWGRWVRTLRTARGMTQEELERTARLPKNTVGRIERGDNNVGVGYVWPLADALGVRPADLFRVGAAAAGPEDLQRLLGG